MLKFPKIWRLLTIAALLTSALNFTLVPVASAHPADTISLTDFSTYSQNFDAIGTLATATLPTDWKADKQLTTLTVGTYTAAVAATERQGGNSMSTTASNGIYNFGAGDPAAATDRAIGFLSSSSATKSGNLYAYFNNGTGIAISSLNISYNVEKYRGGTNAAGFSVQLYYSLNGTTWTPAGSDFLTSFAADASNSGYATAPGATTSVLNKALNVNIPVGSDFYLAWNYSVASGTTTSNAQALGIDDFSLTPVPGLPTLSITDVTKAEGNSGTTTFTFNVGLSTASASDVTFDIATADGTATAGSDYVSNSTTGTILAGNTSTTFDVTVNGDTAFETDETFNVNVTNPSVNATIADGVGLGTIINDDLALPVLTIDNVTKAEGDSGTQVFTFTVGLDTVAPVGGVTFDIATADGTATAGVDYVANSVNGATIAAGNTSYTFDVLVNGDATIEPTETFYVDVTNVNSNATVGDSQGVGTITNDDGAVTPNLSINDVTLAEGDAGTSLATFTVSLDIPAQAGGVTFDIATADGTATAGSDYAAKSVNTATILEGASTATFAVTINGDTAYEADETYNVNVSGVTGANVTDAQGLGTITNDDLAPVNLSINDVTLAEGNSGTTTFTFTVTLDSAAQAGGVTFDIATNAGTATAGTDYVTKALAAQTIAAGNTTYTFDVLVNGDLTFEANETFFVDVSNASGNVIVTDGQGLGTITNDDAVITPTYTIQGSGAATTLTGTYTTMGVVVGDFEGGVSPQMRGFYIQDQTGDGNPATSDGLFVFNGSNNSVALGDLVRVTGAVSEYQGQTQISATSVVVISSSNSLTPTDISLPFASAAVEEQYEGMLVRVPQTLFVTEIYQLGRFGQVTMSGMGKLYQPTNIVLPGAPAIAMQAANNLNMIVVDDALNTENPDPILFGRGGNPLSASNTLRGGDTLANLVGVFTYTWGGNASSPNAYRIRPNNTLGGGIPNFIAANARPDTSTPPVVGGTLKVVGMNTLNYFNSFTSCYPSGTATDCRGANNATEYDRQSAKTVSAIIAMDADVIGVAEMENDGYDASSAIQDLVNKLNAVAGTGTYAFINPDTANGAYSMGTDAIKVGILYKPSKVTPVGITAVLNSTAFVNGGDTTARNRPTILQAFQQISTGERFLFNVNHLKSKGSCPTAGTNPGNDDVGDGQSCWSLVRTNAANALLAWFATDPTGTGDPDILIVGDLNSYAKEDPIVAFEAAGYTNMANHFGGSTAYSYVFDGQWGYLDYAIGSPSLLAQTTDAIDWHINSDEPSVLDYNTEFKTAGQLVSLYNADPFRISDHDPVITGLNLTSSVAPTVTSIVRVGTNPTNASSVDFAVTFSKPVTGVSTIAPFNDFDWFTTGVSGTSIIAVSGSGATYTVTVNTGTGSGTIRLDVPASATITDLVGNPLASLPYTGGDTYTVNKTYSIYLPLITH